MKYHKNKINPCLPPWTVPVTPLSTWTGPHVMSYPNDPRKPARMRPVPLPYLNPPAILQGVFLFSSGYLGLVLLLVGFPGLDYRFVRVYLRNIPLRIFLR